MESARCPETAGKYLNLEAVLALDFWHLGILGLMGVFNNAAALWTNGQNIVLSLGKTNLKEQETTMANICFIKILAVCGDSAQATKLTDRLNLLAREAAKRQEALVLAITSTSSTARPASSRDVWHWRAG